MAGCGIASRAGILPLLPSWCKALEAECWIVKDSRWTPTSPRGFYCAVMLRWRCKPSCLTRSRPLQRHNPRANSLEIVVRFAQVFETLVIPFWRNFVARPEIAQHRFQRQNCLQIDAFPFEAHLPALLAVE